MDILILDDGRSVDALLSDTLNALAHPRVRRATPATALQRMKDHADTLGLVLIDGGFSGGLALIAAVRRGGNDLAHLPILMATHPDQSDLRDAALAAGVTDFIAKPFDPAVLRARLTNLLMLQQVRRDQARGAAVFQQEVAAAVAAIEAREREIVTRLVRAAEHRDQGTGDHVQRVAGYAEMIALHLGEDLSWARQLALASTMHDVGKIAVPDAILLKDGPLTPEERMEINKHTHHGFAILDGSQSEVIQLAAQISISHHERWDGAGHPYGLSGEAIPLCGRIVAVADVFDALCSERSYKKGWPLAQAEAYLASEAGAQFDPRCVTAFLAGLRAAAGPADTMAKSAA